MNLTNLTILDSKRNVIQEGKIEKEMKNTSTQVTLENNLVNLNQAKRDTNPISKLDKINSQMRSGKLNSQASNKMIMRTNPKMLNVYENVTIYEVSNLVSENLLWLINIKKLLINWNPVANKFKKLDWNLVFTLDEIATTRSGQVQSNSLILRETLINLLSDDILNPAFGPSSYLLDKLVSTNRHSQFIKELQVLFQLKRKYFARFSDEFALAVNNDINSENLRGKFQEINNIEYFQPRFNAVNTHLFSFKQNINEEELQEINKSVNELDVHTTLKAVDYQIHGLGLYKRINNFCKWLDNGIIQSQHSLNRLNQLKIRRDENKLDINYEKRIENNFEVWSTIKNIEAFMLSLEEQLSGEARIVGVTTPDITKVLNVSS